MPSKTHANFGIEDWPTSTTRRYHTYAKLSQVHQKLKVDQKGICNGCAQGKNIKNPFPKRDSKAEGTLELIHSDVCGPMPSSSISGYVYYVSFIDDYSRKTWIYFLNSKDEVFSKFKEFKALIENLSERKIKILRSDNGGKYTSKEFVKLLQRCWDQEGTNYSL
jgi:transposase InsO family protein